MYLAKPVVLCLLSRMEIFQDLCDQHGVIYKDKKSKYHHLKTHHNNVETIKCGICSKKFKSKKDLTNHIVKDQHSGQTIDCSSCEKTFSSKANLKKHFDRIHKKITFGCANCGRYMSTKQKLKFHYQKCKSNTQIEAADPLPASNNTPQKSLFDKAFVDFVQSSNDAINECPCEKCDKIFRNKNSLNVHTYRYHAEPEKLICEFCQDHFKSRVSLKCHMKSVHNLENNIVKFGPANIPLMVVGLT